MCECVGCECMWYGVSLYGAGLAHSVSGAEAMVPYDYKLHNICQSMALHVQLKVIR